MCHAEDSTASLTGHARNHQTASSWANWTRQFSIESIGRRNPTDHDFEHSKLVRMNFPACKFCRDMLRGDCFVYRRSHSHNDCPFGKHPSSPNRQCILPMNPKSRLRRSQCTWNSTDQSRCFRCTHLSTIPKKTIH